MTANSHDVRVYYFQIITFRRSSCCRSAVIPVGTDKLPPAQSVQLPPATCAAARQRRRERDIDRRSERMDAFIRRRRQASRAPASSTAAAPFHLSFSGAVSSSKKWHLNHLARTTTLRVDGDNVSDWCTDVG